MTGIPNYPTVKISKLKLVSYSLLPEQERNEKKLNNFVFNKKQKGTAIPLQAQTGPEGSRSLTIPDFNTIDA
jgi:hypothetical protein